jgi:prepilin-type N-terminal cleavage/methylation domain-containing protein
MKIFLCHGRKRGLTLVELLVVIVAITILYSIFFSGADFSDAKRRAMRIQCVNNLKQTGLALRVWEGDHGDKYPMELSMTNGGTMEFTSGPNLFRHFQILSNELGTPNVLVCPIDKARIAATNFVFLNNSNVSWFVGLNSSETNPQMILSGDNNITNGTPIRNGILELTSSQPLAWTAGMHNKVGNLVLADGSVQQVSQVGLRQAFENSNNGTNHLQMPVLAP